MKRETVVVLKDPEGKETARWRVELFIDKDETLKVRFLEGWFEKASASVPVAAAIDVIQRASK